MLVAIYGAFQLFRLPIDAVPDITNKQVQINVSAAQFSPLDMERLVTFPMETALAGHSGTRLHAFDLAQRLRAGHGRVRRGRRPLFCSAAGVRTLGASGESLPEGVQPQMGPVSTGLGEVLMWSVDYLPTATTKSPKIPGRPGFQPDGSYLTTEGDRLTDDVSRLAYLRTIQDWVIRPQLRTVEGLAGVDSIGGYEKQFLVQPDPSRLGRLWRVLHRTCRRAREIEHLGRRQLHRARRRSLPRSRRRPHPPHRRDRPHHDRQSQRRPGDGARMLPPSGSAASFAPAGRRSNGKEVVIGTALMLAGENSRIVAQSVAERLDEVKKSLPPGVRVTPLYDRSALVDATIWTVEKNLIEGAMLVIAALFWLLGNIRAAIIAALVIPLSFLMMAIGMNRYGVSGNLMSLGALDFGLIVDGSIIIIENCLRRLAERQHHEGRLLNLSERLHEVFEASKEMVRPTIYGQAIILLVFAPLLMFSGVEGKMFTPMAITVILALIGAFILSLTFVPAMVAVLIRGKVSEKDVAAIRWVKRRYQPLLAKIIAAPRKWVVAGVGTFVFAGLLFTTLGQEFIPQLDEGDVAMQAIRIPSTSLDQSVDMQKRVESAIASLPEVAFIYSKTGTAEVATDPMPQNASDAFIILKPEDQWPADVDSKDDVVERIEAKMATLVGNGYEVSQPIEMRFNELIAGVRGDVAIKLFGDDLDQLEGVAAQVVLRDQRYRRHGRFANRADRWFPDPRGSIQPRRHRPLWAGDRGGRQHRRRRPRRSRSGPRVRG